MADKQRNEACDGQCETHPAIHLDNELLVRRRDLEVAGSNRGILKINIWFHNNNFNAKIYKILEFYVSLQNNIV